MLRQSALIIRRWWKTEVVVLVAVGLGAFLLTRPTVIVCGEPAWRVQCASHLRQIGQALLLYCRDNGGRCPPSFVELARVEPLTPEIFICPKSRKQPVAMFPDRWPMDLDDSRHCSYVYVADGIELAKQPSNAVLAFEPWQAASECGQVLYADGNVESMNEKEIKDLEVAAFRQASRLGPVTMPAGTAKSP